MYEIVILFFFLKRKTETEEWENKSTTSGFIHYTCGEVCGRRVKNWRHVVRKGEENDDEWDHVLVCVREIRRISGFLLSCKGPSYIQSYNTTTIYIILPQIKQSS